MSEPIKNHATRILAQVRRAVLGKDEVLLWVLAAILAEGHILLEDIPGVGKTTMALAFSKTLGLECRRVQFTPDVLPSDVTGYTVLDPKTLVSEYRPGAVLCNLFLADELNRATSRTQSALLEAMEEGQVTVDAVSHPVPQPFIVIATQNPVGAAGTQPLPDSQMDRFMLCLRLGYPAPADEVAMVAGKSGGNPVESMTPLLDCAQLCTLREITRATYLSDEVMHYAVTLIGATRTHPDIRLGASPRATLAVVALSRAVAQLRGRDYVTPEDVRAAFGQAVPHRLLLSDHAQQRGITAAQIVKRIAASVKAPALK